MKKKKISFKYYLGKGKTEPENGFYPLYIQVVFNKDNTKIKAIIDPEQEHYWREADLEKFLNQDYTGSYRGEALEVLKSQDLIEDIVRYEFDSRGENYKLRGLGDRLRIYRDSLLGKIENNLFESYLLEVKHADLNVALPRSRSFAQNFYSTHNCLNSKKLPYPTTIRQIELYVALSLFSDLKFAGKHGSENSWMVYYWVHQDAKNKFTEFVHKLHEGDPELLFDSLPQEGILLYESRLAKQFIPSPKHLPFYLFLIDNQVDKSISRLPWQSRAKIGQNNSNFFYLAGQNNSNFFVHLNPQGGNWVQRNAILKFKNESKMKENSHVTSGESYLMDMNTLKDFLDTSKKTILRMHKDGAITLYKMRGKLYAKREEVIEKLENGLLEPVL